MMKEKRKGSWFWAVLVILLAAVVGTVIWLLFPRPLAKLVDTSAPAELHVQRYDRESAELTVEPGTPEMEALADVLARHTYHLHWTSLFGSTGVQSYVSDTYRILYDDMTIRGTGERSCQFGGELTWFKQEMRLTRRANGTAFCCWITGEAPGAMIFAGSCWLPWSRIDLPKSTNLDKNAKKSVAIAVRFV